MFNPLLTPRDIAERYNRLLPEEIRHYLKGRGIPATLIDRQLLGWNGERVTIPVFGRTGEVLAFRYAQVPSDPFQSPEVTSDPDAKPELYGWETLARMPHRVVICEGEFDRLVLEARGFPAVASIGGAETFLDEWAPCFEGIKHVYVCFSRRATDAGAKAVQHVLPRARIAGLPAELSESGTVSDFFVKFGRTRVDFEVVLAGAASPDDSADQPPQIRAIRPVHRALQRRADRIRKTVRLHEVVSQFTDLHAEGRRLVGYCPLHDDVAPSFAVYPETDTYRCGVCGAEGDIVSFLMNKESMTFGQALVALEEFAITHELYGTS